MTRMSSFSYLKCEKWSSPSIHSLHFLRLNTAWRGKQTQRPDTHFPTQWPLLRLQALSRLTSLFSRNTIMLMSDHNLSLWSCLTYHVRICPPWNLPALTPHSRFCDCWSFPSDAGMLSLWAYHWRNAIDFSLCYTERWRSILTGLSPKLLHEQTTWRTGRIWVSPTIPRRTGVRFWALRWKDHHKLTE